MDVSCYCHCQAHQVSSCQHRLRNLLCFHSWNDGTDWQSPWWTLVLCSWQLQKGCSKVIVFQNHNDLVVSDSTSFASVTLNPLRTNLSTYLRASTSCKVPYHYKEEVQGLMMDNFPALSSRFVDPLLEKFIREVLLIACMKEGGGIFQLSSYSNGWVECRCLQLFVTTIPYVMWWMSPATVIARHIKFLLVD